MAKKERLRICLSYFAGALLVCAIFRLFLNFLSGTPLAAAMGQELSFSVILFGATA